MLKLRRQSPRGGHLTHLVPEGKWSALCGYGPSAPNAYQMVDRSGWRWFCLPGGQKCAKCYEKFNPETMEITNE